MVRFRRLAASCALLAIVVACDRSPTAPTPSAALTSAPPAAPAAAAAPELTSVSPGTLVAGTSSLLTVSGSGFARGTTSIAISGSAIAVADLDVASPTSLTARVTVERAADIGARSLTVTTAGGTTAPQTLTITPAVPGTIGVSGSALLPGRTGTITIAGSGFVPGMTTVTAGSSDVTVVSVDVVSGAMVAGIGTTLRVTLSVASHALPGPRTLTVTTPGGSTVVTIAVAPHKPEIPAFRASPVIILTGQSSTLSWSGITGANSCSLEPGIGAVPCADSQRVVTPASTTEYTLYANGPGGREWQHFTVVVESPAVALPTGSLTVTAVGTATFVVPDRVTQLTATVFGARGGNGETTGTGVGGAGGEGARVTGTLAVTPGETLTILVGGAGGAGVGAGATGGFNGGGSTIAATDSSGGAGGGASELRRGGTPLVVAGGGGGGGAGYTPDAGGAGGAGGQSGLNGGSTALGTGGGGATPGAGGTGGTGTNHGTAGTGGAGSSARVGGGGGGGGVFGGGGGGISGAGGGGGSSLGPAGAVFATGVSSANSGNGKVVITW